MPVSKKRTKKPVRQGGGTSRRFCSGEQLDHADGSMSCTRGKDCAGVALAHAGWRGCRSLGPCTHCDGPPVAWTH